VKSGMQRFASQHGIIVINSDTSPRGVGEHVSSTADQDNEGLPALAFGESAGFYLDATESPWSMHWRMYSYFVKELVPSIFRHFPIDTHRCGIIGHSMGGHGAITIGLKHPELFSSVSALAAVCHPSKTPFSEPFFRAYLGENTNNAWAKYDSVELAKAYTGPPRYILIDQGSIDSYLVNGTLQPEALLGVKNDRIRFDYRFRPGFEHGYYYVSTFIGEHFDFHVERWKEEQEAKSATTIQQS